MAEPLEQQNTAGSSELLGAIDIGSNSIRMVIGQLLPDGTIELLEKAQRAVRLGQDAFRRGHLERPTMQAAVSILREFKRRLESYPVRHVWTVATSAIRESYNADVFIDRVFMTTGLKVSILDWTLEGRLTVSALRSVLNSAAPTLGSKTLITEVGGGNTMVTILQNGEIEFSQSLSLGSIRLQEMLGTEGLSSLQAADLIRNEIVSVLTAVKSVLPLEDVRTFFAIGADARFAASKIGQVMPNPAFTAVRGRDFERLTESLTGLSVEQIAAAYDLAYAESETLLPALMIYRELLNATRSRRMIVASVTIRDGLLLELARRCRGQQDTTFAKEVIESAQAIAEKYHVNLHHAGRVAACAVQLFDKLQSEHGLNFRHRVWLEAAAVMHEIGTFVSTRAYHKHTYYLIANSQIYGLTRNEDLIVANVARYHRRSIPKPSHFEYMSLPQEERLVVNKLASLLRLAKALDVSDIRDFGQLSFNLSGDTLTIGVPGFSETSLRRQSLRTGSSFFEDVFGLRIEFKQI
jgi:exopolyphosphatase / guanosine-5'-triphosphate,3'-diphosphate pyrophosphatase